MKFKSKRSERWAVALFHFVGFSVLSYLLFPIPSFDFLKVATVIFAVSFLHTYRWTQFKSKVLVDHSWKKGIPIRVLLELRWSVGNGMLFSAVALLSLWFIEAEVTFAPLSILVYTLSVITWSIFVNFGGEFLHVFKKITKSRRKIDQQKSDAIKIRQEVLQDLISPHFLFNSLNTISSYLSEDKDKSMQIVKELRDLYSFMLNNTQKTFITIQEDLDLAKKYIFLLKTRFENAISVDIIVKKEYLLCLLPPMSLQNLVENCVKHNVASKRSVLHITIEIEDNHIVVRNNLNLKDKTGRKSTNLGLNYIQSQIEVLANRKIIIDQTVDEFVVKLPLIYESNLAKDENIIN